MANIRNEVEAHKANRIRIACLKFRKENESSIVRPIHKLIKFNSHENKIGHLRKSVIAITRSNCAAIHNLQSK